MRGWGSNRRQRLRLWPLYQALRLADWLRGTRRAAKFQSAAARRGGVAVIIPERDAPDLLRTALSALMVALQALDEPRQIIVVVNGAPLTRYDDLAAEFAEVVWLHHAEPLGFSAAIERGLASVLYDWTFLLNNDMTLAPSTLRALAALRGEGVFAIAAEIVQQSADGRREETGFTDWYVDAAGVHVYHAEPTGRIAPSPHLCASGGAALFHTRSLRNYVTDSRAYDPFYWEDVEWGLRAWRDGMSVLFVPGALATHRHRATTARYHAPDALARIVERNRWLFDARNAASGGDASWLMRRLCDLPYASQRELAHPRIALNVLRRRRTVSQPPGPPVAPTLAQAGAAAVTVAPSSFSYRMRSAASGVSSRACVLVVTPFAIFPPRHGGARRTAGLLDALRADFDIVLLSDEAALYDARSFAHFNELYAVELLQREEQPEAQRPVALGDRMLTHAHAGMRHALDEALQRYRPALVQVEHVELAALVAARQPRARWVLALHDAVSPEDFGSADAATGFAQLIARYDAVTVCSEEDAGLISHRRTVCVPNGTQVALSDYQPSTSAQLLFVGPFRYRPNLDGIREFLRVVYPAIRQRIPAVTLRVLGGDGARKRAAADTLFAQAGVEVMDHRDDVPRLLTQCALSVNPLTGIRGSAVKVIESLSAGRVCVSTAEGARGFLASGLDSLIVVRDVAAMIDPIVDLLRDADARRRRETPCAATLARYQWPACAAIQAALWRQLL